MQPHGGFTGRYGQPAPAVDTPNYLFLARHTTNLTVDPNGPVPSFLSQPGPASRGAYVLFGEAPSDPVTANATADSLADYNNATDLETATNGEGGTDTGVRVQTAFQVTPLFTVLRARPDGRGQFNFTAPPSLGTYVVRAYAATVGAGYGGAEVQLRVRRPLSLTPSLPRFARLGDVFEAGVLVTLAPGVAGGAVLKLSCEATSNKGDGSEAPIVLLAEVRVTIYRFTCRKV